MTFNSAKVRVAGKQRSMADVHNFHPAIESYPMSGGTQNEGRILKTEILFVDFIAARMQNP